MSREVHARFCERLGVRFPGATRLLIGVIGSKREAREIMTSVEWFLTETLKLTVAPEKSGVHAASKGVTFLGYRVSAYKSRGAGRKSSRKGPGGRTWRVVRRPTSGNVSLRVPRGEVTAFCRRHGYGDLARKNGRRRQQFVHSSDRNIVLAYNSEFRGFANYYSLADDVKSALGPLELVVLRSFVKTLAMRHRTTTAKITKRLRKGTDYEVASRIRGEVRSLTLWRLKHLTRTSWTSPSIDDVTRGAWWVKGPNDLIDRLNARECEACGDTTGPFVMHHRRGARDRRTQTWTNRSLPTVQRRTLVLCPSCRQNAGSFRQKSHMESRVH